MPAGLLAAALVLLVLDFLLGGLRLHLWVRRLEPEVRYSVSLRAYLVNLFAAAIAPMAVASGPAQLATLVRAGVRPARAVAALLLNFVGVLSALLAVGAWAGAYLLATVDWGGRLGGFERALLVGSATSASLLVVAILNPRAGAAVARAASSAGSRLGGRLGRGMRRLGAGLEKGVAEYRAALRAVRAGWRLPLAGSFSVSVVMLLNKCAIGFLVAVGLGFSGGYLEVAARQGLQLLFLYFSPTPGGSGIAEASVPVFLAGIVPAGRWLEYALLWRAITSYLGVAVGAVAAAVVFAQRRPAGAAPEPARAARGYAPEVAATRSARCERDRSTQFTLPNSPGTNSGLRVDPG